MTNSTLLIDLQPEHAGAGEDAGGGAAGAKDEAAAGVHHHYSTVAASSRAPPRLELEVDEPLLRLIRFIRSVVVHAAEVGLPRAEEEEEDQGEAAKKKRKKGRRRLRRVAVRSLQLGERKIARTDEVDIAAKFQYRKPKKIVCQLSRRDAFLKINVLWSNIQAMCACFQDARFDTLKIEVKSASERYLANRPPPRMHIQWRRWTDLTARNLCLQFDKGTLERSYGKMLYTDPSMIPLTLPPPGDKDEDEEEYPATNTQQTGMINVAPVPRYVNDEAVTPSTRMIASTNTGGNFTAHESGGIQFNDSTEPAHVNFLYR